MHVRSALIVLAAAGAAACGGSGRPPVIAGTGGAGGGAGTGGGGGDSAWTFTPVDPGDDTGYQPELRVAPDGRLAAAWYRPTGRVGSCVLPGKEAKPTDVWEIVFGVESGGTFETEVVTEVELVGRPTGLSLAFDGAGAAMIAYMGGEHAEFRCGGTDAMLSTRAGAAWSHATIDEDGAVPSMIFDEDLAYCEAYQDACNQGGVVGLWPALGWVDGAPVLAYRDIHFGFGVDAEEKSDLQLWWGGQKVTAEVTSGGGEFTRLAVDDAGGLHIAHYNRYHVVSEVTNEYTDGIWLIHHEGGAWSREKVSQVTPVGETLALAATADRLGLAWHDVKKGVVSYVERKGVEWSAAQTADGRGRTGLSPSLAFDGLGRPALAYQRCGSAGQPGADCAAADDALRFAIRNGDGWKASTVRSDPGRQEGLYTSLAFDAEGRPAILFQESFFDALDQVVRRRLVLAKGETP